MLHKLARGLPYAIPLVSHIQKRSVLGFSFNLSDRCPIGCQCYWRALSRVSEMGDEAVVCFFEAQRQRGMLLAAIVGGEPYVRPQLLRRVAGILPATWVVTSGTTPLLHLKGTTHFVSIDGADATTHDTVRHSAGLYERILKNLTVARAKGTFPVVIHSVLNSSNWEQIERILDVWQSNRLVDGVIFSTATPINGMGASLSLTVAQRTQIVQRLTRARRTFGKFLTMSEGMIARLDPRTTETQTPQTCLTASRVLSFDASGKQIPQCILGEKADCSACGCVITAMFEPFTRFDLSTWRVLARLYTP